MCSRVVYRRLAQGVLVAVASAGGFAVYLYRLQSQAPELCGYLPPSPIQQGWPETYFAHTVKEPIPDSPKLNGVVRAKVCVVGGGLAGLATAMSLVERGVPGSDVVLIEAQQLGWGASSRNAGFALNGFQVDESELDQCVGSDWAPIFYEWTKEASRLLANRVRKHSIQCDLHNSGSLVVHYSDLPSNSSHNIGDAEEVKRSLPALNQKLGTSFEFWPQEKVQAHYPSPRYTCGVFDPTGHVLHPLNLVLGLCRVLTSGGVRLFQMTPCLKVSEEAGTGQRSFKVVTPEGEIHAEHVVFTGSVHLPASIHWSVANSVAPVNTYIAVTEPLREEQLKQIMPTLAPHCVCDDRFQLAYFRLLPDHRLLWGGRCDVFPQAQDAIKKRLLGKMTQSFPQLKENEVKIEYAWGGTLALGRKHMPLIGQSPHQKNLWYATGFGGHGVVATTMAGELIAESIVQGQPSKRLRDMQAAVPLSYAGGRLLGGAVAQCAIWGLNAVENAQLWWSQYSNR